MAKDYNRTSIGFIINERPKSRSGFFNSLSQGIMGFKGDLSSKFGFFSSTSKPISYLKLAATTTALSSLALALNPDIVGATVGDIERGREAAISHTAIQDKDKSGTTRLGEFIGNFENEFNKGRKEGVYAVMQRRIQQPPPQ